MYYIINITGNPKPEDTHAQKAEVFMFPVLCRVSDIISGHLTLEDACVQHCSEKYPELFRTPTGFSNDIIETCVRDIVFAHPTVPVIGVFCDGKYNKLYTMTADDIAENIHLRIEPLLDECKI